MRRRRRARQNNLEPNIIMSLSIDHPASAEKPWLNSHKPALFICGIPRAELPSVDYIRAHCAVTKPPARSAEWNERKPGRAQRNQHPQIAHLTGKARFRALRMFYRCGVYAKHLALRKCVVCGNKFPPKTCRSKTCGHECSVAHSKAQTAALMKKARAKQKRQERLKAD
jgi:hypothetical protein